MYKKRSVVKVESGLFVGGGVAQACEASKACENFKACEILKHVKT